MKNVTGSLLTLLAVVSLALSAPVSANPQAGEVKKVEAAKKKDTPKPKGPATSQGSNSGQPGQPGQPGEKKTGDEG